MEERQKNSSRNSLNLRKSKNAERRRNEWTNINQEAYLWCVESIINDIELNVKQDIVPSWCKQMPYVVF